MGRIISNFIKAILAGICIGIGAIIYLSCADKIIGSFLFGLGLFTIVFFGFNLYTGKVGYLIDGTTKITDLIDILFGNLIGAYGVGTVIQFTRVSPALIQGAQTLCAIKLLDNPISLLILAIFCGMLMYIAVEGKKRIENPIGQVLIIFIPVMVFILCGFEHCIANMVYFTIANAWNEQSLIALLIMIAGNSLGGMLIPLFTKITQKLDKN